MPALGGQAWDSRSGLLEVGSGPDLLAQVLPHLADVPHGGRRAPAAGEPAPHAAPRVALVIPAAPVDGVQPGLVPVEAGTPDGVRGVGVHGGGAADPRPARLLIRVPVLQDAVALRALALGIEPAMAGRAGAWVRPEVALGGLAPPAFHRGLGEDDALVDAPLAGGPPQDLLGGAGEVAVDARRDQLVGA